MEENSCDWEVFTASSVADIESPEYISSWWVFQNVISNCLTTTNIMLYCIVVLAEVSQTHASKSWQVLPNDLHGWLYTTRGLLFCDLGEVTLLLQTPCPPGGRWGHLRILSPPWSVISVSPQGGTQQLSECLADRIGWKNVRLGSAVTAIWQVEYSNSSLRDWWGATQR